jgi:hypothetical protein
MDTVSAAGNLPEEISMMVAVKFDILTDVDSI